MPGRPPCDLSQKIILILLFSNHSLKRNKSKVMRLVYSDKETNPEEKMAHLEKDSIVWSSSIQYDKRISNTILAGTLAIGIILQAHTPIIGGIARVEQM